MKTRDGETNTAVDTLTVGTLPVGVAANRATDRIYVTNRGTDNNLLTYDGLTNGPYDHQRSFRAV
ncbi:hypothetical protein [Paenibacillus protaetiae]|uniref:YncE family protein n=1 Tax=Paenibacillus protaetiae TaxID=2509456 RepID=A0A4P6ESI9_9BACL|nr:hypothetical protein [Paenibacillus protaetiae]QAY65902.1 hypothetical protein ET464_05395 [Paenibacillus protaetiae]